MNVSSTKALARESKTFEATFLSTDDPPLSWLKHQFLKYFEELLTTTEVRQEHVKSLRNKKRLYHHKSIRHIKITVHTVVELAYKVIN